MTILIIALIIVSACFIITLILLIKTRQLIKDSAAGPADKNSRNTSDTGTISTEENDTDTPIRKTRSRKLLVIADNDRTYLEQLQKSLQTIFEIITCDNGKSAWEAVSRSRPDAVILELNLGNADGAELCRKIKKNPETGHIPVIILTSSYDEDNQQRSLESGADRFLSKSVSFDTVRSAASASIASGERIRNRFSNKIDYGYSEIEMEDSLNTLISKVISVIRANFENPDFSVEQLSHEVGISRVHLNRKLKEAMNISPSNLIKSMRLKQAAYLLIKNRVNISEVAFKVGFSTHSYFSNSFHDYFGMSPKDFVTKYMNRTDDEALKEIFQ